MPKKMFFTLVFLYVTINGCFGDDDHEMEEFLKREYSLSKPYQGILIQGKMNGWMWGRCFQNNYSKLHFLSFIVIFILCFRIIFLSTK